MSRSFNGRRAFTLIELMAVVLVIALLVGITLGVTGYIQKRMAIQSTRAQLAAVEAGLEVYKSDWGYYPVTSAARISVTGIKEATNNWYLYRALSGTLTNHPKCYVQFSAQQIRTNALIGQPTICDFWGIPINYYNSPKTPYSITADPYIYSGTTNLFGYTLGGQVNVASYDLFSYGPDQFTWVSGATVFSGWDCVGHSTYSVAGAFVTNVWMFPGSAADDITNFGR